MLVSSFRKIPILKYKPSGKLCCEFHTAKLLKITELHYLYAALLQFRVLFFENAPVALILVPVPMQLNSKATSYNELELQ
jgi:hypothetical protein